MFCLNNSQCNLMMFSTATMKTTDRQRYSLEFTMCKCTHVHSHASHAHCAYKIQKPTMANMNEKYKVNICLRIEFQMCHFQDSSNFQFNRFELRRTSNMRLVPNTMFPSKYSIRDKKRKKKKKERQTKTRKMVNVSPKPVPFCCYIMHLTHAAITQMNRHVHVFPEWFLLRFDCFPNERFE